MPKMFFGINSTTYDPICFNTDNNLPIPGWLCSLWGGAVAQWQGVRLVIQRSRVRAPAATLLHNNLRQVVHTPLPLSPISTIWYQRKLGGKQAHHMMHQPRDRHLADLSGVWLRATETEISAALRASTWGGTFTFTYAHCASHCKLSYHYFTFFNQDKYL